MTERKDQRPTIAEIDLDNLAFNFHSARRFVGHVRYMAVVKADAYGHGAIECSRRLDHEGVDWFAVATPEEGIQLREAGIRTPILCLGGVWPGYEPELLHHDLTPVVVDIDSARRLSEAAEIEGRDAVVHIKIDTGMGRVGVPFVSVPAFANALARLRRLRVGGVMTHFAAADDLSENDFTNEQISQLHRSAAVFEQNGFRPEIIDMANSPGAIAHPNSRGSMVRLGGILYGLGGDILPKTIEKPELKPVMALRSKIFQIKEVPAGMTLGYSRTFVTARSSVIGTVPIGYNDGYPRGLSNNSHAIVNGSFVYVVGRVSMDWILLDLTDAGDAQIGTSVTLIGSDGSCSISAEELAERLGTISYEITCGISSRVPRVYKGSI